MESKLNDILREDETLLWSAAPEQVEMMSGVYKPAVMKKIISVVAGIVLLGGWYIIAAMKNGVEVQLIAILVCALPFLYSIYNDFSDSKKLNKQTLYAMTDLRMITMIDKTVSSIDYAKIEGWKIDTDGDGVVSLLCGDDAIKGKESSRRAGAVCGAHVNMDTDLCESYVMYGITADADVVSEIAAKYI